LWSVKVAEIIKLIEKDGWFQVRQSGSHRQFRHPTKRVGVTIAGKPSRDLPLETVKSIMKQSGLG
jgi:predicted RNA binding protein YcfA (HicA-like mRNA interferase family)